eukprot:PhF_6_TR25618/c0_g1_i1/m.35973
MDDDKFPVFFLGITSVALICVVGLPLMYTILFSMYNFVMQMLQLSGPRRRRYGEEGETSPFAPVLQLLDIVIEIPKYIFLAAKNPNGMRAGLGLWWKHPSLFFQYSLPNLVSFFFRLKLIVLLLWLLSFYVFWSHVPRSASYDLLGVPPTATPEELKTAYRALSFRYHPDKDPSPEARDKYIKIRKAYQRLTGQKDKDGGDADSMEEEPLGVSVALPWFLRDTENEGRTLILLLLIAFGVPALVIYYLFFRGGTTYQSAHKDLRKAILLANAIHKEMGMPENPKIQQHKQHVERVTELLKAAGVWQKGMGPEIAEMFPPLSQLHRICSTALQGSGRPQADAKTKIAALGFEDEAMESLCNTITNEAWTAKCLEPTESKESLKLSPVSISSFEISEYFLAQVMAVMEKSIQPFDMQGKSKKLFKLYSDKLVMLKKFQSVGVSTAPASAVSKLLEIDDEILITHRDIERSALEYLNSSHNRSWKRYQRNAMAEQRKQQQR